MKTTQTILLAVGAFGAAGLLYLVGKRASAAPAAAAVPAGAATWYGMDARPAQVTQAAIENNWRQLDTVFKTQPDFYI